MSSFNRSLQNMGHYNVARAQARTGGALVPPDEGGESIASGGEVSLSPIFMIMIDVMTS